MPQHAMNAALLGHMHQKVRERPLIFVDLETTGLDERRGFPLELALLAVDPTTLAVIDSYTSTTVTVEARKAFLLLDGHDVYEMHQQSGLLDAVLACEPFPTQGAAVQGAISWLRRHAQAGQPPMVGNSVHFDRRWVQHHWPELAAWFHRRNIDVSSLRELWAAWGLEPFPKPEVKHRALDDLFDCVAELRHYRSFINLTP